MRCARSSMLARKVRGRKKETRKKGINDTISSLQDIIIICRPGWECTSTLHLSRKCGREAGSDFHENRTGGRADQRGCLILGRGEAGRRFFCNNEVKKGPSPCVDDLRGGASLLPAPCPDRRDLPLRLEERQQAGERDEEEKVLAAPLPPPLLLLLLHVPFLTLQPNIITWHQRYWPIFQSLTPEPRCGYGNLEFCIIVLQTNSLIKFPPGQSLILTTCISLVFYPLLCITVEAL